LGYSCLARRIQLLKGDALSSIGKIKDIVQPVVWSTSLLCFLKGFIGKIILAENPSKNNWLLGWWQIKGIRSALVGEKISEMAFISYHNGSARS
jgi:hypothetical protein